MTRQRTRALILLVDDSATQAQRTADVLQAAGLRVRLASNGREALEWARRWRPDAIVSDVLMPIMDGFALCREVRRDPALAQVPVVLYTSTFVDPKDEAFALGIGASRFLVKPADPAAIVAEVGRALARGHAPATLPAEEDEEFLKGYGERLAAKLEQKVAELEEAYRLLEQRSREKLDQAERYSQSVVETAHDAFVSIDETGIVTTWNRAAETMFGWSRDEAIGQPVADLIIPERYREQHWRGLRRFVATGEEVIFGQQLALEAQHRDGGDFPVEIAIWPTRIGESYCFNAFVRDISEEKQAQAELARLDERVEQERATLAAIMASMSDGLVLMDTSQRVRYCNARAITLLGIEEIIGLSLEIVLSGLANRVADPHLLREAWTEALFRIDEYPSVELTLVAPRPTDIQMHLFPVIDDISRHLGIGVVLRNVTHEREVDRLKNEVVSVVSHELRTPLASIMGFAELLLTHDLTEEQRCQFLGIMVDEGQRLTAMLNDFLDLQRMDSGGPRLTPVPTPLGSLIEHAVVAAGSDPERPIVLDVPEDLPEARADPDRVLQVLANLLSNARKYSPGGGEIVLSAGVDGSEVTVAVADRGLGIPPEALPQLFEKFYRIDNADRRRIRGTGLGLAISRKIVEAHGGRIWAESAGPGMGSTFRFTLPLATERQP